MSALITVAGNAGAGKTTLVRALGRRASFAVQLETHGERPFQAPFAAGQRRYALPNQVDYLLYRAAQERAIRADSRPGLQDGGLDLDFHLFTRYFQEKGWLNGAEFDLCQRLYGTLRALQPPPELIIWLQAPLSIVRERYRGRGRAAEAAQAADLAHLDRLLHAWLEGETAVPILPLDAADEAFTTPARLDALLQSINAHLTLDA